VFSDQFGNSTREKTPEELTSFLAQANGFDLSYLTENSQGILAGGQIRFLLMPLLSALLFIILPAGVIVFQLNNQGFIKRLSSGSSISVVAADLPSGLLIVGGILILVILLGLYYLITTALDILGRSVLKVEGVGGKKLKTSTDSDGDTTTNLYYVVNGQQFKVNKNAYLAFEKGRNYRVYFTPLKKIMVNIEVID